MCWEKNKIMTPKINFIDVGSAGNLPLMWQNNSQCIDRLLTFDPLVKQDDNCTIIHYNNAVFDLPGSHPFYIYNKMQCSSLKMIDSSIVNQIKEYQLNSTINIDCVRLDEILNQLNIDFDFIKIDTQGSDFEVIKSLGKYLTENIIGIHTEQFYKPMYIGTHLLDESHGLLVSNGFTLAKVLRSNATFGDFLYLRHHLGKASKFNLIKQIYGVK
jgi:FkbM family methyltransferase